MIEVDVDKFIGIWLDYWLAMAQEWSVIVRAKGDADVLIQKAFGIIASFDHDSSRYHSSLDWSFIGPIISQDTELVHKASKIMWRQSRYYGPNDDLLDVFKKLIIKRKFGATVQMTQEQYDEMTKVAA